ncbi:MAG: hypothetical protein JWQ97_89, partial [Phenylobacterium sp.]|nr:hypothetical protein [Phenylobacterium sp.]
DPRPHVARRPPLTDVTYVPRRVSGREFGFAGAACLVRKPHARITEPLVSER